MWTSLECFVPEDEEDPCSGGWWLLSFREDIITQAWQFITIITFNDYFEALNTEHSIFIAGGQVMEVITGWRL